MATTALGRPVGADGEKTRQRIIAAAMQCMARNGYAATTIREIARTAGMTSAALYNYFPNKSDLIAAAVAARAEIALPRLRAAARAPGNVADRLEAVLDESGRLMREYPDLAAFEFAIRVENAAGMPAAGPGTGFQAMREIVHAIVADAYPSAARRSADLAAAVEAVYALVYGLTALAATASPQTYQRALDAAKRLIRGTLIQTH
jgi:AcrR family transcriptional regulator